MEQNICSVCINRFVQYSEIYCHVDWLELEVFGCLLKTLKA